ncbi:NADH-quinone oxidoreductase subunit C [Thioclava sp. IC9]|uniref:NADH-quinone oxidoreductase subunit C n=1 Tax=Thioclava sp. IC9 TaxID=1973007 RepID=UPI000B53BFE1|nr:NADH-quinone oxidoreductase subunit C [Thioclava sp. IC9]OWY07149.1 NADH-quinone oxidoreductase subunit C [Thioclava sp. IC9]
MDDTALRELAGHIELKRPDDVVSTEIAFDELTVTITTQSVPAFTEFLRDDPNCRFTNLVDITAIDWPERPQRFDVVWHYLSMYRNQRIRVKTAIREEDMVPSITKLHPCADWFEREIFDMFGILFSGHPDLRRLLTDYGFRGHPLRKDFPTTGYVEVRYDEVLKRVVYEPVKLTQEYRQFDFLSPWEGAKYILPGDEKGEEAK